MIRGRVRRLEADLTSSRRLAEERGAESVSLQRALETAEALAADRLEAVNRLEDDLAIAFRTGGGGGGETPRAGGGGGGGEGGVDDGSGNQALRELLGVSEGAAGEGDVSRGARELDHGVLGIVQVCVCVVWLRVGTQWRPPALYGRLGARRSFGVLFLFFGVPTSVCV